MGDNFEAQIEQLQNFSLSKLQESWRSLLCEEPPPCRSRDIFRRILAWRIQQRALGGFSPETRRRLKQLSHRLDRNPSHLPSSNPSLKPGTVLVREWKGVLHRVQVLQEGFEYAGERYTSLSEVARKIAGTRWSGPLFFGLKQSPTGT